MSRPVARVRTRSKAITDRRPPTAVVQNPPEEGMSLGRKIFLGVTIGSVVLIGVPMAVVAVVSLRAASNLREQQARIAAERAESNG